MDSTTRYRSDFHLRCGRLYGSRRDRPRARRSQAIQQALSSIAQQPDEAGSISRTLFIGLAMIESIAIYCLVISIILIFANPFWSHVIGK